MESDNVKAVAEAAKETAIATKAAIELASSTGEFFRRFVGESLASGGDMLSDQIRHWRRMRLLDLEARFEEKCQRRGFDPGTMRKISYGQAELLLDAASREDSDDVRELWANLLTNCVDPERSTSANKTFIFILQQIGSHEAIILNTLGQLKALKKFHVDQMSDSQNLLAEIERKSLDIIPAEWKTLATEEKAFAIGNLQRLRCVAPVLPYAPDVSGLISQLPIGFGTHIGPIGAKASSVDINKMNQLIQWISRALFVLAGNQAAEIPEKTFYMNQYGQKVGEVGVPELNLDLTEVGSSLLRACAE